MGNMQFVSTDSKYKVSISDELICRMLTTCLEAGEAETGGILVGYYTKNLDCAVITKVSSPPDSYGGRTSFYRGISGLRLWLNRLWFKDREYYLGEWHLHPYSSALPSACDRKQMRIFSNDKKQNCPEPLLLIIGGDVKAKYEIHISVFIRGGDQVVLHRV